MTTNRRQSSPGVLKCGGEALKGDEEAVMSDADALKIDWLC